MGTINKKEEEVRITHSAMCTSFIVQCTSVHDTVHRFSSTTSHYVGRLHHTWETGSSLPLVGDYYAGCMKCGDWQRSSSRTIYTIIIQNQADENKSIKRNKILFSVKMDFKYLSMNLCIYIYIYILIPNSANGAPKSFS